MIIYWPTCLLFDYVILWLCLLVIISYVFLWLCFPNIYISIFSLFYFKLFSSNFKLYLFLTTNENTLFSNIEGRFFTFVFAPCVPSVNPWFTLSVTPLSVFIRFCCYLLRCVAIVSLIIPLCHHTFSSTRSYWIVQSTGAFVSSITFQWPTCLLFHVPALLLCALDLEKLSLHTPPLFHFATDCYSNGFLCSVALQLSTQPLFVSSFSSICFLLLRCFTSLFCLAYVSKSFPICSSSFLMSSSTPAHHPSAWLGTLGPYFSRSYLMLICSQN